ncbi:MAG: hypothetical protein WCF67_25675 [Chitinophagaceae bacterium]
MSNFKSNTASIITSGVSTLVGGAAAGFYLIGPAAIIPGSIIAAIIAGHSEYRRQRRNYLSKKELSDRRS